VFCGTLNDELVTQVTDISAVDITAVLQDHAAVWMPYAHNSKF
jgi:hypothetical protein